VSTAIRRYNLGSKLQTVSKLAKVSGALAIVGGTITAVTEFRRAQKIRGKEGLTEEAGIAYANAAAGALSAIAGATLLIPIAAPAAPVLFAISGMIQGATWVYANRKRIKNGLREASKTTSKWASGARAKLADAFKRRTQAIGKAMSPVRTKLTNRFSAMRSAVRKTTRVVARATTRLLSPARRVASRLKGATTNLRNRLTNLFKRRFSPPRPKPRPRRSFSRSHRVARRWSAKRSRWPASRKHGYGGGR